MNKYIALLRGINLGNRNKILMADLKELFINLGFSDIKTYIQTGNVVFNSPKDENPVVLSDTIEKEIFSVFGFNVSVIIRTDKELEEILENNPFIELGITDTNRFHLTFLEKPPKKESLELMRNFSNISGNDKFRIVGKTVFIYCSEQYMNTKFGNNFFEKKLDIRASTRNWKTASKIYELTK